MGDKLTVAIITASDKGSVGEREDISGKVIKEIVEKEGLKVVSAVIVPDDFELLCATMKKYCDQDKINIILTTGGTGFSKRDVTPEATLAVAERRASGVSEAIRAYSLGYTKRAMLSRGECVIRGESVILNLPGSPKAVAETLEYSLTTLLHGVDILLNRDDNCARA